MQYIQRFYYVNNELIVSEAFLNSWMMGVPHSYVVHHQITRFYQNYFKQYKKPRKFDIANIHICDLVQQKAEFYSEIINKTKLKISRK